MFPRLKYKDRQATPEVGQKINGAKTCYPQPKRRL
jgi:hypothetical protein